jgi:alpha-beta hydrolase superfamily lysophospholipase
MLFVGYPSTGDTITGASSRLRRHLPNFYPVPHKAAMGDRHPARLNPERPYTELVLVGHSLGGVVLRNALVDAAQEHRNGGDRSVLLEASLRLFSPAHSGFRGAGALGRAKTTPAWKIAEFFLRDAAAYSDLQPGSETLVNLKDRTNALSPDYPALRASIVWANPDEVVMSERFENDIHDSIDRTDHRSVCKPKQHVYEAPWDFTEHGRIQ